MHIPHSSATLKARWRNSALTMGMMAGGVKRIMLVIASYLSKLGRDISEDGLTLKEVEAFFASIGERVRTRFACKFVP